MRSLLFALVLLPSSAFAASPTFEIVDGDRVMLLGDTLLEREATYGHLEIRMHEQFPAAHFSVRNIAWSAETPLGWSRASFDPADKGIDRLKEHIELVQPTVAVLGFGMAASLQEITDRSNDWTLNPDPARYGAEPMTAARFKKELAALMDTITASARGGKVRFVLLSPIDHEDLRSARAGLPDPTAHNALLADYRKVIAELAEERDAAFVPCDLIRATTGKDVAKMTDNGIHLNDNGYRRLSISDFSDALGWKAPANPDAHKALREAVVRKNELWFNRFRPANSTYLFGFRKREQGRNAVEMEQFTPLLKAADEEIWRLASSPTAPAPAKQVKAQEPAAATLPLPEFKLAEGLEISLWAEAPMLAKPVQMNWDAAGRLWVVGTPIYPMIEPGKFASDTIHLLVDSNRDGKADKSTTFADDLLLPTCVEPDITMAKGGPASAAYVGASTELLYLRDTNGDGVSDQKRIVLSGFGTEDTHHNIHTLYWGPDGLLYFSQSVYTHSHMETPWGIVRLNSGGVLSYDPRTERTQVFSKGLWNTWGHKIDKEGQHFLTDGAGSTGLSWAFPGATFAPFEGARQTMASISPGGYPKFSGLELIHSPNFPAAWQGSAVTCDFRAHKVVHFELIDLGKDQATSGYTTKALPVLVQTNDLTFRPIDVKLGPDGALYIADWTNPIINHGEVDFRDPRRDHSNGRIWRVTYKGGPIGPLDPRAAAGTTPLYTAKDIASSSPRTRIGAMRTLARTPNAENAALILAAAVNAPKDDPFYAFAAWRSVNDIGAAWVQSVLDGKWKADVAGHPQQLEYALQTLPPAQASQVLAKVIPRPLPADGSGPWIELIGKTGSAFELDLLWQAATEKSVDPRFAARALAALTEADEERQTRPSLPPAPLLDHLGAATPVELLLPAVRLAGAWKVAAAVPSLSMLARDSDAARLAAIAALREIANEPALTALKELVAGNQPAPIRAAAATALGTLDFKAHRDLVFPAIAVQDEKAAQTIWRALFATKGTPDQIAAALPKDLPKPAVTAGLAAARELGKRGDALVKAFTSLSETATSPAAGPVDTSRYLARTKTEGDAQRGERVYRRASLVCTTCHAIGGAGGKVGPDLSSIGASAPLDYLIESMIAPNAKVKEGYNAILLTQKDGKQLSGVLVRENPDEFILRDTLGNELQVPKASVTARENVGSIMPSGLLDQLNEQERLDLFAFLSTLGKPGAFDSSKANVARQWELWPAGPSPISEELPMIKRSPGLVALTLVDGRLTRGMITEKIALLPADTRSLHARTRFTLATAGKAKLNLSGARKAWLDHSPLPIASEPSPTVELKAGSHQLEIELDPAGLPDHLKVESEEVTFIAE
jgi:putative heme-binding domain-containing protein